MTGIEPAISGLTGSRRKRSGRIQCVKSVAGCSWTCKGHFEIRAVVDSEAVISIYLVWRCPVSFHLTVSSYTWIVLHSFLSANPPSSGSPRRPGFFSGGLQWTSVPPRRLALGAIRDEFGRHSLQETLSNLSVKPRAVKLAVGRTKPRDALLSGMTSG